VLGRDPDIGEKVQEEAVDQATGETDAEPESPVMPSPPFPTFRIRPTLPHQTPGVGFESGRDSRAR
jgi:hypothetical protein